MLNVKGNIAFYYVEDDIIVKENKMALNELNRLKDNFPFERIQVKIRSCFN
jgi:hypothetical protein